MCSDRRLGVQVVRGSRRCGPRDSVTHEVAGTAGDQGVLHSLLSCGSCWHCGACSLRFHPPCPCASPPCIEVLLRPDLRTPGCTWPAVRVSPGLLLVLCFGSQRGWLPSADFHFPFLGLCSDCSVPTVPVGVPAYVWVGGHTTERRVACLGLRKEARLAMGSLSVYLSPGLAPRMPSG